MGLENSTTISGLNASWPLGTDPKSEGDNHIRLIKSVLQSDAYRPDNILDAPTQSSGVPTGGIVASVSSGAGQGTAIRFADGTQICQANISDTNGITLASGSLFIAPNDLVWTFRQPFISAPQFAGSLSSINRMGGVSIYGVLPTGNEVTYRPWASAVWAAGGGFTMRLIAIGRWF